MASTAWRETFTIEPVLLSRAAKFSFIQAVRLLHRITGTAEPFDCIRVRPDLAWNTPAQEIISIEKMEVQELDSVFRITVTFLELYGAGSPLPMFYTQDLFKDQTHHDSVCRGFIDIFNGILYEIDFNIWRKYNFIYRLFEKPDPELWEQLFCIAGIGRKETQKQLSAPQGFITYSGITSRPVRTAEGLRILLSDTLKEVSVTIEQCVTRLASIPQSQRVSIGWISTTLGVDIIIGKQMRDRMGAFRVHIGPVSAEQLSMLHPNTRLLKQLHEQVRCYIDQPLQWDYEIKCKTDGMATVQLGGNNKAYLGWNSWVYSGKPAKEQVSVRFNLKQQ